MELRTPSDSIGSTQGPPAERADAARNRARILDAAAKLFQRDGVDAVSMDAIAAEAGVGKGTLFRRFGSKAGLAAALLNDVDRNLQERIVFGAPPLGPGAPAGDRILAFLEAYLDLLEENLELVRLSETASPGARYHIGSYGFWHTHLAMLLREACPALDADCTAYLLLAPLGSDLHHALREKGYAAQRIRAAQLRLARCMLGRAPEPSAPEPR